MEKGKEIHETDAISGSLSWYPTVIHSDDDTTAFYLHQENDQNIQSSTNTSNR